MQAMYYLPHLAQDAQWGVICTAVGSNDCDPDEGGDPNWEGNRGSGVGARNWRVAEDYLLLYVTKGQGYFQNGEMRRTLIVAGDVLLVQPGVKYICSPDRSTGWSQMWVSFKGDQAVSGMVSSFFTADVPVIHLGPSDTVYDLFGRIMNLGKSEKLGVQQAVGGFIYALLGYMRYKAVNSIVSQSRHSDKVHQARMLIRENIENGISPADIARNLGMSYSLLRQQFHAMTGISMSEYFTLQRINLAKTLLSTTDKSIKEIAFESGYESVSRFCTAFTQYSGITASEFRRRNSQKNTGK